MVCIIFQRIQSNAIVIICMCDVIRSALNYVLDIIILTHSDVGKPVQLDISLACSHCFRVFITTIQGLLTVST